MGEDRRNQLQMEIVFLRDQFNLPLELEISLTVGILDSYEAYQLRACMRELTSIQINCGLAEDAQLERGDPLILAYKDEFYDSNWIIGLEKIPTP